MDWIQVTLTPWESEIHSCEVRISWDGKGQQTVKRINKDSGGRAVPLVEETSAFDLTATQFAMLRQLHAAIDFEEWQSDFRAFLLAVDPSKTEAEIGAALAKEREHVRGLYELVCPESTNRAYWPQHLISVNAIGFTLTTVASGNSISLPYRWTCRGYEGPNPNTPSVEAAIQLWFYIADLLSISAAIPGRVIVRSDLIDHAGPGGLLDVRTVDSCPMFFIAGQPWLYECPDDLGSLGEYLICLSSPRDAIMLSDFRLSVDKPPPLGELLRNHLAPIIPILVSGKYTLNYCIADGPGLTIGLDVRDSSASIEGFYPNTTTFVATQPSSDLSQVRVADWARRIREGERPSLVTVSMGEFTEYLLDGHHKLAAYQHAGVPPRFYSIVRRDPPSLKFDDLAEEVQQKIWNLRHGDEAKLI